MQLVNNVFLDKNNTDCLKGIFAICVLIHHICNRIEIDGALGSILASWGYLSVAIFFVLSGYGLAFSYKSLGGGYLLSFNKNKVIPYYILQCVLVLVYLFAKSTLGIVFSRRVLVQSFLFGDTIVSNGWYLQEILLLYLLFYFSFRWVNHSTFAVLLFTLVFIGLCMVCGLDSYWYESTLCFGLGFIICEYRDILVRLYKDKKTIVITGLSLTLLFVLCNICYLAGGKLLGWSDEIRVFIRMMSALLFSLTTLLFTNIINLNGSITKWLSKHYLEIYLFQGITFIFCWNKYWQISNTYIGFLLSFIGSLILAGLIHPLVVRLIDFSKKIFNNVR